MLGEIRVRADEEKTTKASRYVTARFQPPQNPTANAVIANPAQNGRGRLNTFMTDDGCPLGRTCPYEHPT
eukprot:7995566-Prorocentrum_lima.AAC.1